jgi:RHS repeat-associated protein
MAGQTTWYAYDRLGNLRQVSLPDGRAIEYVVDGLNRRAGKKMNGALVEGFLYEGQLRPVAWLDARGAVKATFVYGTRVNVPEYMVASDGTAYRFLTDHLGSPRLVVEASSGAIAQRLDYDEWGQVLADSTPGFQPFGFAGGLYDRDTGLVRFGARDYDPAVGRWTNKDTIRFRGGLNLYAYAANDPIKFIDPKGTELVLAGVGAVLGGAVNALNAYATGGDVGTAFVVGFMAGGIAGFINNPFAAGAIAGLLTTAGNRTWVNAKNTMPWYVDYPAGACGGGLGGGLGKILGQGSLSLASPILASDAAGELGVQIGGVAGSVIANDALGWVDAFNQINGGD